MLRNNTKLPSRNLRKAAGESEDIKREGFGSLQPDPASLEYDSYKNPLLVRISIHNKPGSSSIRSGSTAPYRVVFSESIEIRSTLEKFQLAPESSDCMDITSFQP